MTRVLRSTVKNSLFKADFINKLSITKKSKNIKKRANKKLSAKREENNQFDIWDIRSIKSNIFKYIGFKDLVNLNTVCKRWNSLTNPVVRKTIELNRKPDIMKQIYGKRFRYAAKKDEIAECISCNAQHAPFVKELRYNHDLEPLRAIRVFETFRFICKLTIERCNMSQGQFLGMIIPLNQLQELAINTLKINNTYRSRFYKEGVQLPSSLKKLRVYLISLVGNTDKFVKTINSHSNLVEFSINSHTYSKFLEPFYKPYPTLLNFEFNSDHLPTHQSLFGIFEHNSQLIYLKLALISWSSESISHINSHLINLKELKLSENRYYNLNNVDIFVKFSQPTKIKKLILEQIRLSNCSLNSILLNCPHLEELDLNPCAHPNSANLANFFDLAYCSKLKILSVNCDSLSEGVFESILLNSPHISELNISLGHEWKGVMKSIYEKCNNLYRLIVSPPFRFYLHIDTFNQEFYKSEFFTNNPKCEFTLTHLTLNRFNATESKAEYFKNFKNLKTVKYLNQPKNYYYSINQENEIDMCLWPGYKLLETDNRRTCDYEFKRN